MTFIVSQNFIKVPYTRSFNLILSPSFVYIVAVRLESRTLWWSLVIVIAVIVIMH